MRDIPHTIPDTYLFGPPSGTFNIGSVQEKLLFITKRIGGIYSSSNALREFSEL